MFSQWKCPDAVRHPQWVPLYVRKYHRRGFRRCFPCVPPWWMFSHQAPHKGLKSFRLSGGLIQPLLSESFHPAHGTDLPEILPVVPNPLFCSNAVHLSTDFPDAQWYLFPPAVLPVFLHLFSKYWPEWSHQVLHYLPDRALLSFRSHNMQPTFLPAIRDGNTQHWDIPLFLFPAVWFPLFLCRWHEERRWQNRWGIDTLSPLPVSPLHCRLHYQAHPWKASDTPLYAAPPAAKAWFYLISYWKTGQWHSPHSKYSAVCHWRFLSQKPCPAGTWLRFAAADAAAPYYYMRLPPKFVPWLLPLLLWDWFGSFHFKFPSVFFPLVYQLIIIRDFSPYINIFRHFSRFAPKNP